MPNLTARFSVLDNISGSIANIAQAGMEMTEQFEQAGIAASAVFDNISENSVTVASSIDGTATSIADLQSVAESTTSSTGALSESMNNYQNSIGQAAEQTDSLADSIENYEENLSDTIQDTERLGQSSSSTEQEIAALEAVMRHCGEAAGKLSFEVEKANEQERNLSQAMERAAQVSEQLAQNSDISTEAREAFTRANQEAEEAINELTATQQEAQQAMAEYDSLLASGTNNLDELEQAAQRVSRASGQLNQANQRAANATNALGEAANRVSEQGSSAIEELQKALAAAGIAKMVLEIKDAFMEASTAAAEFETGTKKISTIADTTQVSLSQISSDILDLSRDTGIFAADLEEATYSALSASVNTANAVEFTATASKLATGGFTSSAIAVDVLTTALNAYGLEASEAGSISDMLITTQNLGKTTVDELAASVGKAIPLASAYGVQMDNLSAAYAELTKGGIATAEAGTYLKAMLTELGDSGSDVSEVLIARTGSSFAQLIEQGYSLGDVMAELGASVNGDAGAFNELWSSSEAGIGALSLYNAGAQQFNTTLTAMQTSIGATDAAYAAMTDTTAHAQEEMANAANNLKIAVGQNLNPMIESLYQGGTKILNIMSSFAQEHPIVVKAVSAVAVAVGVAATALSGFAVVTQTAVIPAIVAFATTLNTALGPIRWITIGVAALVTGVAAFVSMLEKTEDETAGMTAVTREQYYELQNLNGEYERVCAEQGELSDEALTLKYQLDDLSASFAANRQTVEQFTAEADALCQSVQDLWSSYEQGMTEINAQEVGAMALIQKYQELSAQADLTTAEQKELEAVSKKLSQTYPELSEQLKNAVISTEEYSVAIERVCAEEAERRRQQQAEESFIEGLQKQKELAEEIAKAEENIRLEEERISNMSGWERLTTFGETDDLKAYQMELEELTIKQEENNASLDRIRQNWGNTAQAAEQALNGVVTEQQAVSTAYETVKAEVEALCTAYDEAYLAALKSFEGQFSLFDKAEADTQATVGNVQAALDSQLSYWDNYLSNIETLKTTSYESLGVTEENYNLLMSYVQDGSAEAAGLADSLAAAIESGNQQVIIDIINTLGEVQSKQQEAAAATADWETNFSTEMDGIQQKMQETVQNMNMSDGAKTSADETINSYINGIKAGESGAVAAAQAVANKVAAALSSVKPTMNIGVATVATAPEHANGSTNAESVFIAGEKGPELIAKKAATYATGTTDSTDYFIAGENGPELIIGEPGSTVFPTQETDRLIQALNHQQQPLQILPSGNQSAENKTIKTFMEQEKHILIDIAGSGKIEVGGKQGISKETVLELLSQHLKPVLMNIIQNEIYEEGELSYEY